VSKTWRALFACSYQKRGAANPTFHAWPSAALPQPRAALPLVPPRCGSASKSSMRRAPAVASVMAVASELDSESESLVLRNAGTLPWVTPMVTMATVPHSRAWQILLATS